MVLGCLISASLMETLIRCKQYHQKDLSLPPRNSKLEVYTTYSTPSLSHRSGWWTGMRRACWSQRAYFLGYQLVAPASQKQVPLQHPKPHTSFWANPQLDGVAPIQGLVSIKKWPSQNYTDLAQLKPLRTPINWRLDCRGGTRQKPRTKFASGLLRVAQTKKKLTMCTCQHSCCANFLANTSKAF